MDCYENADKEIEQVEVSEKKLYSQNTKVGKNNKIFVGNLRVNGRL